MEALRIAAPRPAAGEPDSQSGMTLIELMVALSLFAIVIAAIYHTYTYQQEAYLQTESRVNMVQEARAAQFFLARDLKMAGYNPTEFLITGFNDTDRGRLGFTMDIAGTGDFNTLEIVRFALTSDAGTFDDGICPTGTNCRLSREWCSNAANCGGLQPVAEGVDAIEFCYIVDRRRATTAPTAFERGEITSVIVSVLMRQTHRSPGFTNTTLYTPASVDAALTPVFIGQRPDAWGPFNDPYRRKLLIFEVKARNLATRGAIF